MSIRKKEYLENMNGRLIYFGDHSVGFSFGGHAFLAKLIEGMASVPRIVVEAGFECSSPEARLSGVEYRRFRFYLDRLERSRFCRWHARVVTASLGIRSRTISRVLGFNQADCLITIAHDFTWLPAIEAAHRNGARSIVFCHDEWLELYGDRFRNPNVAKRLYRNQLSKATKVMAVSEGMKENLKRDLGVESEVFLPHRRGSSLRIAGLARPSERPFRFAYCGQLWAGYWETLKCLAMVGNRHGWEIDIYTNKAGRNIVGEALKNVRAHDFLPEEDLVGVLARNFDALVVALPFDLGSRRLMETMFSSKLAEYTLTELPIVLMGPEYAQVIRWGRAQGCFFVIDQLDPTVVEREILVLANNEGLRSRLGLASAELGSRCFSADRAVKQILLGWR